MTRLARLGFRLVLHLIATTQLNTLLSRVVAAEVLTARVVAAQVATEQVQV
jgi:hypothetical protein